MNNYVKYTAYFNGVSTDLIEHDKFDDSKFSLTRNRNYHGMSIGIVQNLTFYSESKQYFVNIIDNYGENSDVKITKYIRGNDGEFKFVWDNYIDFSDYDIDEENNSISIKLKGSKPLNKYNSKKSSKIYIDRSTNIDDENIEGVDKKDILITGRELLFKNNLYGKEDEEPLYFGYLEGLNPEKRYLVVPVNLLGEPEDELFNNPQTFKQSKAIGSIDVSNCLYGYNDVQKDIKWNISINKKIHFLLKERYSKDFSVGDINGAIQLNIYLTVFSGISNTSVKEMHLISSNAIAKRGINEININKDFKISTPLIKDDSIAFLYEIKSNGVRNAFQRDEFLLYTNQKKWNPSDLNDLNEYVRAYGFLQEFNLVDKSRDFKFNVTIKTENESSEISTLCKGYNLFDACNKMSRIIVNKELKSDLLKNGDLKDIFVINGMSLRQMPDTHENYKDVTISFENLYKSIDGIYPIGMDINNKNVIIEKREHFYRKFIFYEFKNISKLKVKFDSKENYSSILVGGQKYGGYEKNQGLDEYNRKSQYNIPTSTSTTELNITTQIRTDSYGIERVRRDNKNFDDENSFDDDVWFLDCEKVGDKYKTSNWEKRFDEPPMNVFSPDTALNLWLSPINILLRRLRFIKRYFIKENNKNISLNNSDGNNRLSTKLIGGNRYTQDNGIPVSDLRAFSRIPQIATFECEVEDYSIFIGKIDGIDKMYGMIKFEYDDIVYYGHILELSIIKNIGSFQVLLYNKIKNNERL